MDSCRISDATAERLRSEILGGVAGAGQLLAEAAVARRLGVSRVPVREALFALERDGLVAFSRSGRAYVKELTGADFEELFLLRLTLEPAAAVLAVPALRRDDSRLVRNIAATRRARRLPEVTRLDLEFHEIILEMGGNARLWRLWRSIRGELELWLGRLHREHRDRRLDTREQTAASHEELLEAFRTQTPAAAGRLMRRHIIAWREWLPGRKEPS